MTYQPINKIIDNLYLGDIRAAQNETLLKQHGITHILQALGGINPAFPGVFKYKVLQVNDVPWENLGRHFMDAAQFIKQAIKSGGKVFVHCWAGISRSTSCICAYMMMEHEITLTSALNICRQGRPIINPNPGFIKQLMEFQLKLKKMRKYEAEKDDQNDRQSRIARSIAPGHRVQSSHDVRRSVQDKYANQSKSRTQQLSQAKLNAPPENLNKNQSQSTKARQFDMGDIPRNYFSSTQDPKQNTLEPPQQPTRQYAQMIIEKAKAQGLQSLSNHQKLLILKEANAAKSSRIKEIGQRENIYKTPNATEAGTTTAGWSHYMDNRYRDKRMPVAHQMSKTTNAAFNANGTKKEYSKFDTQYRAMSGHPSPSYMKPYQPSQPSKMYAEAMAKKQAKGAGNYHSIKGSGDNRAANIQQGQRILDSAQARRQGSLQIPAINRGLLAPALNY